MISPALSLLAHTLPVNTPTFFQSLRDLRLKEVEETAVLG
jgi:hypothetical protein